MESKLIWDLKLLQTIGVGSNKFNNGMKNHFPFWVFIFVLSSCNCLSFKNNKGCTSCSIEIVKETEINLSNLTKNQIEYFLCTIKSECNNNVEFQEYSNNCIFRSC